MFNPFKVISDYKNKSKGTDLNILTMNDYYDRLTTIGLSLFEWENLPESCNERYLEKTLFNFGRAIFFYDETMGYLNMKCTPSGELNIYDEPISYNANSHAKQKMLDRENCVIIRNNYLERPTDETVVLFAMRLSGVERTIDVNINAQKTPIVIRCDEKDRLTMKNLYSQYDGNEPFILGSKNLNLEGISVLKTDAPFVSDKLQIYKRDLWNEVLTFFGINNANSDKRERLITDEVNANNEVISINAQAMLLTRLEACEQINKKYDLNVSVKLRSFETQEVETLGEGEEDNGEI